MQYQVGWNVKQNKLFLKFEGTSYEKLPEIATSSFISCCFTSAYTSVHTIFHKLFKTLFKII